MKPSRNKDTHRPFAHLSQLLSEKRFPLAPCPEDAPAKKNLPAPHPEEERRLFKKEMADVRPLEKDKYIATKFPKNHAFHHFEKRLKEDEQEALSRLQDLVDNGEGFRISLTAEYIQGAAPQVNPQIIQKLRKGRFSIQDHIDLHGLNVPQAEEALNRFLRGALRRGRHAVLIVHGRGLSSARTPVLKHKVYEWLTRGPWRKWVLAFTSARPCDGGAGATYLLLRRTAMTKKWRKKRRTSEHPLKNHMIPPQK